MAGVLDAGILEELLVHELALDALDANHIDGLDDVARCANTG
jgi:hypothetical protein